MNTERYLFFTKFTMETVFFFPNVCRPEPATISQGLSGSAGNRDEGRYFQKMVNSWLIYIYIYIVTLFVPLIEHTRATSAVARVPQVGTSGLNERRTAQSLSLLFQIFRTSVYSYIKSRFQHFSSTQLRHEITREIVTFNTSAHDMGGSPGDVSEELVT